MLPKAERFTKEDFNGIKPKVFFRGELFDIASVILPTQKFACVISKKTLKKSVQRNSVKRKIFNAVQTIDVDHKKSIIVYPKKKSITVPYSQLLEELQKAFATLY